MIVSQLMTDYYILLTSCWFLNRERTNQNVNDIRYFGCAKVFSVKAISTNY